MQYDLNVWTSVKNIFSQILFEGKEPVEMIRSKFRRDDIQEIGKLHQLINYKIWTVVRLTLHTCIC